MAMSKDARAHMHRHRDDVDHIVVIAADNGLTVTARQAYAAWAAVSETSCASWLMLDDDDAVWAQTRGRLIDMVEGN